MKKRLLSLLTVLLMTTVSVAAAEPVYVPYESYTYSTLCGTERIAKQARPTLAETE